MKIIHEEQNVSKITIQLQFATEMFTV